MENNKKKKRNRINSDVYTSPNPKNGKRQGEYDPDTQGLNYNNPTLEDDIDYEDLEDKWYEIQEEYRNRYPEITDDDIIVEPAHFERTIERIAKRTEKSFDEIRSDIDNWSDNQR